MRQPGLIFKSSARTTWGATKMAGAGIAALALTACASFHSHHKADLGSDSQKEVLWNTPGTADLQSEVKRLRAENEKLTTQVAELEKEVKADSADTLDSDAGADQAAGGEKLSVPAAPLRPGAVIASADVDRALAHSPAPPVDPAPRLVQPSFASDTDTVFENEAPNSVDIKTSSVLYGVHLASYRRVEDAEAGWRKLQRENPDELGLLEPRIVQISIEGRGDFLRLLGGGFSSRDKAEQLCAKLRMKKVYCAVMDFDGQRLSMNN